MRLVADSGLWRIGPGDAPLDAPPMLTAVLEVSGAVLSWTGALWLQPAKSVGSRGGAVAEVLGDGWANAGSASTDSKRTEAGNARRTGKANGLRRARSIRTC